MSNIVENIIILYNLRSNFLMKQNAIKQYLKTHILYKLNKSYIKYRFHKIIYHLKTLHIYIEYQPKHHIIGNTHYEGKLTNQSRFVTIGFDDFRDSDFSMVIPLWNKYNATATFNRIATKDFLSKEDKAQIYYLEKHGHELGDHTWFHCNYIFSDPKFNGQDPKRTEGNQSIFPTNEQLKNDRGDGKNAFGFDLTESISKHLIEWNAFQNTWENLTDEQCQSIRNHFSIYKDNSGMLDTLDKLSNKYLKTKGSSRGSWNNTSQCYEGGIFTGCQTSCNHEIWERILEITKLFYQEQYHTDLHMTTWSWPGSIFSHFVFEKYGKKYYDEQHLIPYNYLARFTSTRIKGNDGKNLSRSWTEVLRNAGYKISHDTIYPSRLDGQKTSFMRNQLIYNAVFSRKDALTYSSNHCVGFKKIAQDYPKSFFKFHLRKNKATQMYEDGGQFFLLIETIRKNTANGMIQDEMIDSIDTYSERIFLKQILEYCKKAGIEIVSKEKAYDICFRHQHTRGNLIYNPELQNTAKLFMPNAENIPSYPDGYSGSCSVYLSPKRQSILRVNGMADYYHYGIPLGKIRYCADVKGKGTVTVYAIKNSSLVKNQKELGVLGSCFVSDEKNHRYEILFEIPENPEQEYDALCEGMGEKIMGIKIVYNGNLHIHNIDLRKI